MKGEVSKKSRCYSIFTELEAQCRVEIPAYLSGGNMYSIGLDFGTNSARCVVLDVRKGRIISEGVSMYPSGTDGVMLDNKNPHLARQNPADYHDCLSNSVSAALRRAEMKKGGFNRSKVIGIGVDTTGSTLLPVDDKMVPLSFYPRFKGNLNSMAYLWKDHVATDEAEEITKVASMMRPEYLAKTGGVYSSEWFFSKLLYMARNDPGVFDAAAGFMEICDYIPALLSGRTHPKEAVRSVCAAGHKALYSEEWGGLPDEKFLSALDRRLTGIKNRLYGKAYPAGVQAGFLCRAWSKKLGLPENTPISVGAFDAHMGAVGAGVKPGILVKVIGTSTCDMAVAKGKTLRDIPGICGIVPDSILPGYIGIEAGQSAVGDIFNWFVKNFSLGNNSEKAHAGLIRASMKLAPGETGLLALDWHNGNRNVLVDQKLTGLVLGFTLNTSPPELYRALIEATGFGAKMIIDRLREYGVEIREIVATGGIPDKNTLLMQVYADITDIPIKIAASPQTCALGASIFGAVAAGKGRGGYGDAEEASIKTCRFKKTSYNPCPKRAASYNQLYRLYADVHDSFGKKQVKKNLHHVMKELLKIRKEATDG